MPKLRTPSPAMAVALLALFVALGGTGYAVTKINGNVLKNRSVPAKKLKKNQISGTEVNESKLGKVPAAKDADSAANAANAAHATAADNATAAGSAQTAAEATHAASADSATDAKELGGVPFLQVNMAGRDSSSSCDPDITDLFPPACASVTLALPKTSHVLVIASGSWYGSNSSGACRVERDGAIGQSVSLGQSGTSHGTAATGAGWSLTHLFTSVPTGPAKFDVVCTEASGDFKVSAPQIVAVRLAASSLPLVLP
jgi:hypothetical protein